jgi:hypothetical protein
MFKTQSPELPRDSQEISPSWPTSDAETGFKRDTSYHVLVKRRTNGFEVFVFLQFCFLIFLMICSHIFRRRFVKTCRGWRGLELPADTLHFPALRTSQHPSPHTVGCRPRTSTRALVARPPLLRSQCFVIPPETTMLLTKKSRKCPFIALQERRV